MATKLTQTDFDALTLQLAEKTAKAQEMEQVATVAANHLLLIEDKFSPLLSKLENKKFNIFNALFNLGQILKLIEEILALIRSFKVRHIQSGDTPK